MGLRFFYWRDKNGNEVDLILARNVSEPLLAIEIKSSEAPGAKDCAGFSGFAEDYPDVKRICVCRTPRSYQRSEITFLPWQFALKNLPEIIDR